MCPHRQFNSSSLMTVVILVVVGIILSSSSCSCSPSHLSESRFIRAHSTPAANGTNWAVLIAGSNGYGNYRHQADICHAYQILKEGGLKDENIIVFMYDDIAHDHENPRKGVIINRPDGPNVYKGVPKDYTGHRVTASNVISVLLGDETKVKGGSGKVLRSGPNDNVFIYYADHGSPGLLGMPVGDMLYADQLVKTLKKMHSSKSYSRMVIYIEACDSGSVIDGMLPKGMNIYVTTASSPNESSYATYCKELDPKVPHEYDTCLGDLYSVAWMEDTDKLHHDRKETTLGAQYQRVKKRTLAAGEYGSHVMQYGDSKLIAKDVLGRYMGSMNRTAAHEGILIADRPPVSPLVGVDQREADILYLKHKVQRAMEGSKKKAEAEKELEAALAHRKRVDQSVQSMGRSLFAGGVEEMMRAPPAGHPLVRDWRCLRSMVRIYEKHCGSLETYGTKYMRAFANACNARVHEDRVAQALSQACNP